MRCTLPALTLLLSLATIGTAGAQSGRLRLSVRGEEGTPLNCRIHLVDRAGKPQRMGELPFFRDHFVCSGKVDVPLKMGAYVLAIERGPEYTRYHGRFELSAGQPNKQLDVTLRRMTHLAAEGWYSGDLHVHRPVADIQFLMRAEDLHVAPVITWWNNRNLWQQQELPSEPLVKFDGHRYYHAMAGEDEREGGALMYFNRQRPLKIGGSTREYPSPMQFVKQARSDGDVWIDIEKPFWWDVPVWLASGQVNSVGLANNHMCRSQMYETEAWGRPRDPQRLPPPRGNGFWTQEIYYHILNCGLRVPPSAGSASGVLPNPVGYNRVYVHCGEHFDYAAWWEGLRSGRSFVTNGPLLVVKANGRLPGSVLSASDKEALEISLEVSLSSSDRVPALEIIQNGIVQHTIPVEGNLQRTTINKLKFDRSGWFLVRAITDVKHTFRFASTAPFYVEIGSQKHRISRRSVAFFQDWVAERTGRVSLKLSNADQLDEVLAHHKRARDFWQQLASRANAD